MKITPGVLQDAADYSNGKLARAVDMDELGIDDSGVLPVEYMGLPHPLVPTAIRT